MKIKYKYKIFSLMDSYPTEEDILFEIVSSLEEKSKMNEEFTFASVKNSFAKKHAEEDIQAFLDSLTKKGTLSLRETAAKKFYRVEKNPFAL